MPKFLSLPYVDAASAYAVIGAMRCVAPASIVYSSACLLLGRAIWSKWLAAYAATEMLFYLLIYLPRKQYLNETTVCPPLLNHVERQALFRRTLPFIFQSHTATGWFYARDPSAQLQRENVEELLLWALFSTEPHGLREEWKDELSEYVKQVEERIGHTLANGRNEEVRCMKFTQDRIRMSHRPLLYYLIVSVFDLDACITMRRLGFNHFRIKDWAMCFPLRIQTILSRPSPCPTVGYWYRSHRSSTKDPVIFLHGVGVGLFPYLDFIRNLAAADPDVGIIVIEDLPISSHITPSRLRRKEFIAALTRIMDHHALPRASLIGHSYGTVLAGHALRDTSLSHRISSIVLVDPVAILLYMPKLTTNFVYRPSARWMSYFVCRDPDIARTVQRTFFFAESALWKDDFPANRRVGVVLAGQDHLIESEEIWRYLTESEEGVSATNWKKDGMEVLYYRELGHSGVFASPVAIAEIVDMVVRMVNPEEKQV
ncbi:alpha/beta-hydrolase [Wolfiporia cocos MD-104 SS10]|uniref:Alpha/beta-hydrolase n=1 Tax=Wolfiporia cocos (strain MD-104) TaxID=742152 RepID=A0A2H3JSY1_WOLCO|nr:alpha/beta-hydrolase [Wolfiporia cocos MD-104 SS10]